MSSPEAPHDWLDKHILDQANHWGCSPADKASLFAGAAEYDEMITAGVADKPTRQNPATQPP